MIKLYDIFRVESGHPIWIEATGTFEEAKERAQQIGIATPGDYFILDWQNQSRTQLTVTALTHSEAAGYDAALRSVLAEAMKLAATELGTQQVYNPRKKTLRLAAQAGFDQKFVQHFHIVEAGDAACGTALARRQRVIVEDVATAPIFTERSRGIILANRVRSVETVPLVNSRQKLVGMVSTHRRRPCKSLTYVSRLSDRAATIFADEVTARLAECPSLRIS